MQAFTHQRRLNPALRRPVPRPPENSLILFNLFVYIFEEEGGALSTNERVPRLFYPYPTRLTAPPPPRLTRFASIPCRSRPLQSGADGEGVHALVRHSLRPPIPPVPARPLHRS